MNNLLSSCRWYISLLWHFSIKFDIFCFIWDSVCILCCNPCNFACNFITNQIIGCFCCFLNCPFWSSFNYICSRLLIKINISVWLNLPHKLLFKFSAKDKNPWPSTNIWYLELNNVLLRSKIVWFLCFTHRLIIKVIFISNGSEFWSVNHTSIYKNSKLNVFKVIFFGEISNNWPHLEQMYTRVTLIVWITINTKITMHK